MLMAEATQKSFDSIGGWLILFLVGLVVTPARLLFILYQQYLPFFSEGHWSVLTTPGSEAYHPLWAPLLIGELAGNTAIVVLTLVTLFFFLRRSRLAPRLVITLLAFSLLFQGADYYVLTLIPAVAEQGNDAALIRDLVRAVGGAAIWIPYFLISKRVKGTFTRGEAAPLPAAAQ
jgi:uncharacterized protein DUF2569